MAPSDSGTPLGGNSPASAPVGAGAAEDVVGEEDALSPPTVPVVAPKLLVDPEVSRAKFERELSDYRKMEEEYIRRGWYLVRAEYPKVVVVFAAPQLNPRAVIVGVTIDFTNYDLWAPSVQFVDPFTLEPLLDHQLPIRIMKRVPPPVMPPLENAAGLGVDGPEGADVPLNLEEAAPAGEVAQVFVQPQQLLISQSDGKPFLCIAGTREYHNHPFHSNNPWLAHRGTGVGRLFHILDVIWRHGIVPLQTYEMRFANVQVVVGRPLHALELIPE